MFMERGDTTVGLASGRERVTFWGLGSNGTEKSDKRPPHQTDVYVRQGSLRKGPSCGISTFDFFK
jgi:hypothetical protein